jgi:hypothetical protein
MEAPTCKNERKTLVSTPHAEIIIMKKIGYNGTMTGLM